MSRNLRKAYEQRTYYLRTTDLRAKYPRAKYLQATASGPASAFQNYERSSELRAVLRTTGCSSRNYRLRFPELQTAVPELRAAASRTTGCGFQNYEQTAEHRRPRRLRAIPFYLRPPELRVASRATRIPQRYQQTPNPWIDFERPPKQRAVPEIAIESSSYRILVIKSLEQAEGHCLLSSIPCCV